MTAGQLPPGLAGATVGPQTLDLDARWLMAYAAALGETAPEYFDTTRPEGILAHPLFPVCYEWPLALALRAAVIPAELAERAVHATHNLALHRPPRVGDRLSTTATLVAVGPRRPGAFVITRFWTTDRSGAPVSTTEAGTLYRGVTCDGPQGVASGPTLPVGPVGPLGLAGPPLSPTPRWAAPLGVSATLAHVYSECARIWNPIHTDRAVATGAGLPDIILHGTATLALAVSELLRRDAEGPRTRLTRLSCRFGAMVRLPSTITVRGLGVADAADGRWIAFEVAAEEDGRPAVTEGWAVVAA